MSNTIQADNSGTHLPILNQREHKIKEIISILGLDPKNSRERYLAKKAAVEIYGYPWVEYPKGYKKSLKK